MAAALRQAKDFAAFLRDELESPRFGRGAKSNLATFLGVQPSLISLALSGTQGLSLEQGLKIAEFLGLDAKDTEFALLLLQRDRAGSRALRDHFQAQLDRKIEEHERIHSRVRTASGKLSETDLHEYYGSWFHTAVHMCVRNPARRTAAEIAEALGIGAADVRQSLALLTRLGFVEEKQGKFKPTLARFHVPSDSTALRAHHLNWRTAAARALDEKAPDDLHYSLVMSVDEKAAAQIRKLLLDAVEAIDPVIRDAEDRRVYAFNFDLFAVGPRSG